jgi:hypothetical protein
MTGYNYYQGMSNNALDAYENGKKPLSKITAQDLRQAGWKGTKAEAIRLAKSDFWRPSEWHHSGGTWYNRVEFYAAADLIEAWQELTATEQDAHRKTCKTRAEPAKGERVTGSYTIWGGSRQHPRKIGEETFAGALTGDWIHLDGGGRKKATGNHITWEYA